jgi:hypothetical protein
MIVLSLFAGHLSFYDFFRGLLFVRTAFLLLSLFLPVNRCMVNLIRFIYLFLQFAPIMAELNFEILLLHIRMLLLDLLDPLHDLRLENLFLYGADHLDPFAETSLYIYISAYCPSYFSGGLKMPPPDRLFKSGQMQGAQKPESEAYMETDRAMRFAVQRSRWVFFDSMFVFMG